MPHPPALDVLFDWAVFAFMFVIVLEMAIATVMFAISFLYKIWHDPKLWYSKTALDLKARQELVKE